MGVITMVIEIYPDRELITTAIAYSLKYDDENYIHPSKINKLWVKGRVREYIMEFGRSSLEDHIVEIKSLIQVAEKIFNRLYLKQ